MSNEDYEDTEESDIIEGDGTKTDNEDYDMQADQKTAENITNQIAASDFDPDRVLYEIEKAMNGFKKSGNTYVRVCFPLARTEFTTLYINSMRALVNFHSLFSKTTGEEAAFTIIEDLKAMTYAAVDYGVEEEHLETVINMYDKIIYTFYGIIIEGRGTENIKQVLTSVYKDLTEHLREGKRNNNIINFEEVNRLLNK